MESPTVVERNVFQAKYGRDDELVQLFQDTSDLLDRRGGGARRILTDLTGPFFTVVTESKFASLVDYQRANEVFGECFARMTEVVESDTRELYTLVD